jgi:membrane protein YdbS with pleckstrin-like domain
VQTVDFEQSAVSRLLGLASVTVTTASAAGPLVIDGIDKAVADRLVDDLTRRTEAEAGDAT